MSLTELRRKGEGPVMRNGEEPVSRKEEGPVWRKGEGPVCMSSGWQLSDTPPDTILALTGSFCPVTVDSGNLQ